MPLSRQSANAMAHDVARAMGCEVGTNLAPLTDALLAIDVSAREEERERCGKIADYSAKPWPSDDEIKSAGQWPKLCVETRTSTAESIARSIRAGGEDGKD